ncbi:MAG: intracellular multiplication protein IcmW [uncultured bacterium]|nr:MAG: intracellular multiplication protein IcmW [uncultured bacterium]OGT16068.1 MAG: phosphoesterase [Gammaproteobacteria bacterium RIFCSPHIGHO2_02_FULL_38_33]OGT24634.1 MAG: phosphoesterase [Gammaproteobacteria bacterium RIFCSPHIGHO2_12_38_15]OGT67427.1 MAG: phosphoesterase [Gammaproteobacteria bacterium RIFCSPLOWO2_02_FULL_38_11]OGT77775.1 MAG: phosphoesterase [Gammaproteobacteria bacterium RIFCSPLOWO2_12_FULL_38_14]
MVDISLEGSRAYWREYQDPMIYRVITFMEGVEAWTLDLDPQVEQALAELAKQLDNLAGIDLAKLGHEEIIIKFGSYIKSSRVLRLLQSFDMAHPGAASRILIRAEETSKSSDDPAGLFLRRNIIFERLRLLSRVFSSERCAFITKALEGEHG